MPKYNCAAYSPLSRCTKEEKQYKIGHHQGLGMRLEKKVNSIIEALDEL